MTQSKKDKAENARLLRLYGITLEQYTKWAVKGCHICKKFPKLGQKKLALDHYHYKIKFTKLDKHLWEGWVPLIDIIIRGKTQKEVRESINLKARPLSARGTLCMRCNRAIAKFQDNPDLMEAAAKYIRDYHIRLNLQ